MKFFKKILSVAAFCFITVGAFAQEQAEMADAMRANGKIYVVVSILLLILGGLFVYIFMMDRKITALEKKLTKKG